MAQRLAFRRIQLKTIGVAFVVNSIGGLFVFLYVTMIAPLPRKGSALTYTTGNAVLLFVAIMAITITLGVLQNFRIQFRIGEWYQRISNGEPVSRVPRYILQQVLNYPLWHAALSLGMWVLAALIATFATGAQNWLSSFLQIVGTGGVLTTPLVYLGTDLAWRPLVSTFFPSGRLNDIEAYRLPILWRLLAVFVLISVYPSFLITYIALDRGQAMLVADQPQAILNNMKIAAFFILFATLLASLGMTMMMARGITRPLRALVAAMKRVGHNDFSAQVTVATNDELGYLSERFNLMTDRLRRSEMLRNLLNLYVSPEVARAAIENGGVALAGQTVECTVLFLDIRQFTNLAERLAPDELLNLLNRYMSGMIDIVMKNGGFVNKMGGDSLLAVFGTPLNPAVDHPARAIRTALGMCRGLAEFNASQHETQRPELRVGIGVATGSVVAGNVGGEGRLEYTVLGDTVNLAARLQEQATILGFDILLSAEAYSAARKWMDLEAKELSLTVKGKEQPLLVYGMT